VQESSGSSIHLALAVPKIYMACARVVISRDWQQRPSASSHLGTRHHTEFRMGPPGAARGLGHAKCQAEERKDLTLGTEVCRAMDGARKACPVKHKSNQVKGRSAGFRSPDSVILVTLCSRDYKMTTSFFSHFHHARKQNTHATMVNLSGSGGHLPVIFMLP